MLVAHLAQFGQYAPGAHGLRPPVPTSAHANFVMGTLLGQEEHDVAAKDWYADEWDAQAIAAEIEATLGLPAAEPEAPLTPEQARS